MRLRGGKWALVLGGAMFLIATGASQAQTGPRRGNVPDCSPGESAALCREPPRFDVATAELRLGDKTFVYWMDGETFNVALRANGSSRRLSGTIQDWLQPMEGGLQGATYRLHRLETSLIEMRVRGEPGFGELRFTGPRAPVAPALSEPAHGTVSTIEVDVPGSGGTRKVSVYRPAGAAPSSGYPVVVMADGEFLPDFAKVADGLIGAGRIRPVVLVGVWAGVDEAGQTASGPRVNEYVKGADAAAYERHERFVREAVLPMLQSRFGVSADRRLRALFGYSNGADWALSFAIDHPDTARNVIAFSASGLGKPAFQSVPDLRLFMEAGRYEEPFLRPTTEICDAAVKAGLDCDLAVYDAGHGGLIWQYQFARTLERLFPAKG